MSDQVTSTFVDAVWLKSQSEDLGATAEYRYKTTWSHAPVDPLDVEYDGHPLGFLVNMSEAAKRENVIGQCTVSCFTPLQRSAISAHWSADLRKRTEASKAAAKERAASMRITVEGDE